MQDPGVAPELAVVIRGEIVLHLLQLERRQVLLLEPFEFGVDRRLQLGRRLSFTDLTAEVEGARPLPVVHPRVGFRRDLASQHEPLVEPPRAVHQQLLEDLEHIGIPMPKGHGVEEDVDLRIRLRLGVHPFLGHGCRLPRHHFRHRLVARRNPSKIPFEKRHHGLRFHITHEHQRDVPWRVVGRKKKIGVHLRNRRDVRGPPQDRPMVRMRLPEHRLEGLLKLPQRRRFGPHPPLLEDHVALGIKLPEDGVQEPLALHPAPEFQLVRRDGDEIRGLILGRERVHRGRPAGGVDAVELVLHQQRPLFLDQFLELHPEFPLARRLALDLLDVLHLTAAPRRPHVAFLLPDQPPNPLLLRDDLQVPLGILRAQRRRALEHHVLEKVCDPGDPRTLVRAPHMDHERRGDARLVVPLHNHHIEPVWQRLLDHRHLLCQRAGSPAQSKGRRPQRPYDRNSRNHGTTIGGFPIRVNRP